MVQGDGAAHDALVIGGGPAGLAGAVYLARFRRDVLLVDAGDSRAARIARSHNVAGFPTGIGGEQLLRNMREQVRQLGVPVRRGTVRRLQRDATGFVAGIDGDTVRARTVLLATGALDVEPAVAPARQALADGTLRFCPVCDAYEASGRDVGVLCNSSRGAHVALYLRHFTPRVSVFVTDPGVTFQGDDMQRFRNAGIALHPDPVRDLRVLAGRVEVRHGVHTRVCDSLYSALGMTVHSMLATDLGVPVDDDGYLISDRHQQTCVPGLFVAGDVARGLNQISVAVGEAAIAASAMHLQLLDAPAQGPATG
jgi:thioredoxin reductase (NADPH)